MQCSAFEVDVGECEMQEFAASYAAGVEHGDDQAVLDVLGACDHAQDGF